MSTPVEALFLELGIVGIGTTIKAARVNYLHYLATRNENEMIYKVFIAQWNRPVKNDWTVTVRQDLRDLKIEENLSFFKSKSSESFKLFVKRKIMEFEFECLMNLKDRVNRSKMNDLSYTKLEMQIYLMLENINKAGAQTLFKYRVRMANFGENYRGGPSPVSCPMCHTHLDNQKMAFENCQVLRQNISINGSYTSIFSTSVNSEVVKSLQDIDKFREEYLK